MTTAAIASPMMLVPVNGTGFGSLSSSLLTGGMVRIGPGAAGPAAPVPTIGRLVDAFLYLGLFDNKVLPSPSVYRENPVYLAEIRRRIRILTQVYGGDFWSEELDQLLGTK